MYSRAVALIVFFALQEVIVGSYQRGLDAFSWNGYSAAGPLCLLKTVEAIFS